MNYFRHQIDEKMWILHFYVNEEEFRTMSDEEFNEVVLMYARVSINEDKNYTWEVVFNRSQEEINSLPNEAIEQINQNIIFVNELRATTERKIQHIKNSINN